MVDRFGSLKNWSQFRPFGAVHNELVIDEERMGFTGQERETELNHDWTYHGARYYDTKLRIFTQVDPQMERYPGWSPYTYTLNNPVKNVDPNGEAAITAAAALTVGEIIIIGIAVGVATTAALNPDATQSFGKAFGEKFESLNNVLIGAVSSLFASEAASEAGGPPDEPFVARTGTPETPPNPNGGGGMRKLPIK